MTSQNDNAGDGQQQPTVLCKLIPWNRGDAINLTRERVIIGSHRLCDIIIRSRSVAPVSCQLFLRNGWWYARNLSDASETKINGLVFLEERIIPGDLLWIGSHNKYHVEYEPESNSLAVPIVG